jgi:hypothetical protein
VAYGKSEVKNYPCPHVSDMATKESVMSLVKGKCCVGEGDITKNNIYDC